MLPLRKVLLGLVGVAVAAQLVRPAITNPPVVAEPHWNTARTRELVRGACFDCHSNETVVPWYGQVAPFRWLIAHHVDEGRENMNFSDPASEFDVASMVKEIHHGEMPTWDYRLMHPAARLTPAQSDSLVAGLKATFGTVGGVGDYVAPTAKAHEDEEADERRE